MIRNFKIPIILGSTALAAIILTVIILTGGNNAYGLCITEAYGAISIIDSQGEANLEIVSGIVLNQGAIVTVGPGSTCTITYKGNKNSKNNYIVINQNSQIVITDSFTGKNNGEIFLNRGSLLCNMRDTDKAQVEVRTANSMIYPTNTVTKIEYSADSLDTYSDVTTFSGNSSIQLYDLSGNKVNDKEILIEKCTGRIVTNDLGPIFSYLNIELNLNNLTATDLKSLLTVAALVTDFPYTTAELKEAYDKAPVEEDAFLNELPLDNSDDIITAEPIVTTLPTENGSLTQATTTTATVSVTEPPVTTTAPSSAATTTTTTRATTKAATTTKAAVTTTTANNNVYMVVVIIDGEESIQEVKHGQNAIRPADPAINGLVFKGWDNSFNNITKDTIITALFENSNSSQNNHTVTVVIADKRSTITVKHGEAANISSSVNIDGYTFLGWDTDFSNVTSDITVTALLQPNEYIVNFVVEGNYYPTTVKHGQTAIAPYTPSSDSRGNLFIGWDKPLVNVISNLTVTAMFSSDNVTHTVTFIIDGNVHTVNVKNGESAIPPFVPSYNSAGNRFIGWDKSLNNITANATITAIYDN